MYNKIEDVHALNGDGDVDRKQDNIMDAKAFSKAIIPQKHPSGCIGEHGGANRKSHYQPRVGDHM